MFFHQNTDELKNNRDSIDIENKFQDETISDDDFIYDAKLEFASMQRFNVFVVNVAQQIAEDQHVLLRKV